MKRDAGEMRRILTEIEGGKNVWKVDSDSSDAHHLRLLKDAGTVGVGTTRRYHGGRETWIDVRLTSKGHDFLAESGGGGINDS